jgi:hypothetical protein
MGLAMAWPTMATAIQTPEGFNQSWYVLGPYYQKWGIGQDTAGTRLDYMTDGTFVDSRYIPTSNTVVNTAYTLPQCASYLFVWRTPANGYDVPTIFAYQSPTNTIDVRGSVFGAGAGWGSGNPQGDQRLEYTCTYFWAYANNLTGVTTSTWIGEARDDVLVVYVNGIERVARSGSTGGGTTLYVRDTDAVTLNPGLNLVMAKVVNGTGGYNFRLRLQNTANTFRNSTGATAANAVPATRIRWDTMDRAQAIAQGFVFDVVPLPQNFVSARRTIQPDSGLNSANRPQYMGYTGGTALKIEVRATTSSGHPSNVVVREFPPTGWLVSNIATTLGSAAPITTTTARGSASIIKWSIGDMSLATTNVAYMRYDLTPPALATDEAYCTGTVASNENMAVIGGGNRRESLLLPRSRPILGIFDWSGDMGFWPLGDEWTGASPNRPVWFTTATVMTGDPRYRGKASYNAGTQVYSITGVGADLQDPYERGFVLAKAVTGDFVLAGDIKWTSISMNGWCKAVLMVRKTINPSSAEFIGGIRNYWGNPAAPLTNQQVAFFSEYRYTDWGTYSYPGQTKITTETAPGSGVIVPAQVKLVRLGNRVWVAGKYGANWVLQAPSVTLGGLTSAPILACLAVTSHISNSSATAEFSNVSITPVPVSSATRSFVSQDVDFLGNPAYSSKTLTVRIFVKNAGGTGNVTVRDFAPTSWTISSISHGGTVDPRGTTITWTLAGFSADTTLTYNAVPPQLGIIPNTWPVGAQFWQSPLGASGFTSDTVTGYLVGGIAIVGPNMMVGLRVNLFQQGRYPNSSYAGTADTHIAMYHSQARYPDWGGPVLAAGFNSGWWDSMDEGNNHGNPGTNPPIYLFNDCKEMLIRFETSALDPGYTVFGAALLLNLNSIRIAPYPAGSTTASIHRIYAAKINRPWNEGRGRGADGPYVISGEVSWIWNQAFISQWASWGLRGGALDQEMPESYRDCSAATVGKWNVWDVSTMATQWVKSPSTNFGIHLSQDDQNTTHYPYPTGYCSGIFNFASAQSGTAAIRPMLAVVAYKPSFLAASHWELYR